MTFIQELAVGGESPCIGWPGCMPERRDNCVTLRGYWCPDPARPRRPAQLACHPVNRKTTRPGIRASAAIGMIHIHVNGYLQALRQFWLLQNILRFSLCWLC